MRLGTVGRLYSPLAGGEEIRPRPLRLGRLGRGEGPRGDQGRGIAWPAPAIYAFQKRKNRHRLAVGQSSAGRGCGVRISSGAGAGICAAVGGRFKGYLQRDGSSAYGALARADRELIPVGCWGHARRKFVEAAELESAEAMEIVTEIRRLYLIERHARDEALKPEQRWQLRQELAKPLLEALPSRLQALREKHLPQSPLGKAIRYTLGEWQPLTRYLEDGRLEIDNNLTENAIRPSALGKKNWLFIGHPEAGWRSAVIYSVIVSCRRRGIDAWQYLSDVLERLPAMKQSEVSSILPARWKPANSNSRA
jgi:hypothetical protein